MIISIEGPDFVGKNTLVDELIKMAPSLFRDIEYKLIQFPNYETQIGKLLRKKLQQIEWNEQDGIIFQLLNTAHRYEYLDDFKKAKNNSDFVLFVIRYNLSGPVYASIDGLDATKVWNLYAWFDDYLPDITFIINRQFNYETLKKERAVDHYESELKQKKIREIYAISQTLWGNRLGEVINIDNLDLVESVKKIFSHLQLLFSKHGHKTKDITEFLQ